MTRFTAPLKVKQAFSETTVMSVDTSGNLQFDGDIDFSGTISTDIAVSGAVSGKSTGNFIGPISSGSAAATGFVVMAQQTTLVASVNKIKVAQLPEGADVIDWFINVTTPFATAAAHVTIEIGTSATQGLLGNIVMDGADQITQGIKRVLETTARQTNVSGWNNVTGAGAVFHASVTAVSGAVASGGSGIITIQYIHKV